ncbi:phosphoribosylanthranilate isomerase [Simiduia sp. 21SJ11W-1]|uniref:phosphoribosylanthranilate isomerase n=1 Tax=Simiduia sp. 21SJ11W-1 TaxID=2909669 RepID=UPI00209D2D14|nr:phosphoribosylanthranilate isomerase [Simiduia sp. 21SJ11W-1]UTA49281.1 phosphoribosylanthranilate isomerase [Simiduia sp. 21SJ11W-1]
MTHQRTRIKICGITQLENLLAVEACGVDALGFVFYPPSPRAVTAAQAATLVKALGPFTQRVGLFVNANAREVEAVLAEVALSMLQFHGDEPAGFCEQFGRPYFKALRMRDDLDIAAAMAAHPKAAGFLLDAYRPGVPGGTGEQFDWARVPAHNRRPLVLAGGLSAGNVAQAIEQTGVYGVDLSGGVEAAPGVKDIEKVRALVAAVKAADTAQAAT